MPKEWLSPIFQQAKIGVTEVIPSTMGEPLTTNTLSILLNYATNTISK